MNLLIAIPTAIGGFIYLVNRAAANRPSLDIPGTLTASLGLFALVLRVLPLRDALVERPA